MCIDFVVVNQVQYVRGVVVFRKNVILFHFPTCSPRYPRILYHVMNCLCVKGLRVQIVCRSGILWTIRDHLSPLQSKEFLTNKAQIFVQHLYAICCSKVGLIGLLFCLYGLYMMVNH